MSQITTIQYLFTSTLIALSTREPLQSTKQPNFQSFQLYHSNSFNINLLGLYMDQAQDAASYQKRI